MLEKKRVQRTLGIIVAIGLGIWWLMLCSTSFGRLFFSCPWEISLKSIFWWKISPILMDNNSYIDNKKVDMSSETESNSDIWDISSQEFDTYNGNGFSIKYPPSWTYQDNNNVALSVMFVSPQKTEDPSSSSAVVFNINKLPSDYIRRGMSSEALYNDAKEILRKTYKISNGKDIQIDWITVKKIILNWMDGTKALKWEYIVFVKNGISYDIMYMSTLENFDEVYDEAESIITSFEFE